MPDVQKWLVPEVVDLLGDRLDRCGVPRESIATGRTLVVKARARDDATRNAWADGRRVPLPRSVADSLGENGLGSSGVDVVIETESADPSQLVEGLVLMIVDLVLPDPPDRAEECRRAAAALGLESLADAGPDAVLRLDDDTLKARTRHVITETARVRAARRAIDSATWAQLGSILTASHISLRDDFAVSRAEADVAADAALEAGALGVRMNLALVPADRVAAVRDLVERRFEDLGWPRPEVQTLGVAKRP